MSNPKQIAALAVVWATALFGADTLLAHRAAPPKPATLEIVLDHGCTGCASSVHDALLGVGQSGLGDARVEDGSPQAALVPIDDASLVDFVQIEQALAQAGFSVTQLRLGGGHTLVAELPVPCACDGLGDALRTQLERHQTRGGWIGAIEVVQEGHRQLARISPRHAADHIDVVDALRVIEAAGHVPRSLKLEKR